MSRLLSLLVSGAALLAASSALADVEVGGDALEVEGKEFLNVEPIKLSDLRGRVVVLQFFRTDSTPCAEQVVKLQELQDQLGDQGLTVVGVTSAARKTVEEFLGKNKGAYPVLLESADTSLKWGLVKGYPTTYLIGPDGKVAWKGNWADQAVFKIDALLGKTQRIPRLPVRFAEAGEHAAAGRLAAARKPLAAELAAGTAGEFEKPLLQKMVAWIDAKLTESLTAAVNDANAGKFYEADLALERLATECAELDVGKRAAEGRRQLLSDPARKREVDAGRALAAALEKAKDQKPAKAISLYKAVISKFKDTAAAKQAAELIAGLEAK